MDKIPLKKRYLQQYNSPNKDSFSDFSSPASKSNYTGSPASVHLETTPMANGKTLSPIPASTESSFHKPNGTLSPLCIKNESTKPETQPASLRPKRSKPRSSKNDLDDTFVPSAGELDNEESIEIEDEMAMLEKGGLIDVKEVETVKQHFMKQEQQNTLSHTHIIATRNSAQSPKHDDEDEFKPSDDEDEEDEMDTSVIYPEPVGLDALEDDEEVAADDGTEYVEDKMQDEDDVYHQTTTTKRTRRSKRLRKRHTRNEDQMELETIQSTGWCRGARRGKSSRRGRNPSPSPVDSDMDAPLISDKAADTSSNSTTNSTSTNVMELDRPVTEDSSPEKDKQFITSPTEDDSPHTTRKSHRSKKNGVKRKNDTSLPPSKTHKRRRISRRKTVRVSSNAESAADDAASLYSEKSEHKLEEEKDAEELENEHQHLVEEKDVDSESDDNSSSSEEEEEKKVSLSATFRSIVQNTANQFAPRQTRNQIRHEKILLGQLKSDGADNETEEAEVGEYIPSSDEEEEETPTSFATPRKRRRISLYEPDKSSVFDDTASEETISFSSPTRRIQRKRKNARKVQRKVNRSTPRRHESTEASNYEAEEETALSLPDETPEEDDIDATTVVEVDSGDEEASIEDETDSDEESSSEEDQVSQSRLFRQIEENPWAIQGLSRTRSRRRATLQNGST